MYSLREFGFMAADPGRFGAYVEAIAAAVRPGDTVVEIGAGPSVFSLLACRAGARRVYAIESDSSIQFGRELAAANGFSDRIEFLECSSLAAQLPERVNVIVSDIRGSLPLYQRAMPSLEDARVRMLAPGGIMIPQRDILKAALLDAKELYSGLVVAWRENIAGLNLSPLREPALNQAYTGTFKREQIVSDERQWAVLDYMAGVSPRVTADFDLCAIRSATARGLCLWFEAQLFQNIGFSSAPGTPDTVFGQIFLPWLQPLTLQSGEKVHISLHANLVGDEYVWQWNTTIPASADRAAIEFRQSSFNGAMYSPQSLHRQALDHIPVLSQSGEVDRWMLQQMDGHTTLQQIAHAAAQHFPHIFPTWQEAFRHAVSLSSKSSS
jgi:type I protein arginine methyltransferase